MASSTENIFVTYVDAFHDLLKIWGQPNRTCATYVEKQLMQLVPEFDNSPGPNPNIIRRGMLCFAKYSDNSYYRARVISDVFNNKVMVMFIDYGNKERVDLANIRLHNGSSDSVISKIVPQADEFYLANICSRGGWAPDVINEIRRDLCYGEFNYRMFVPSEGEYFIQLKYRNEDYANVLVQKGFASYMLLKDQVIALKNAFKNHPQNMEQVGNNFMVANSGSHHRGRQPPQPEQCNRIGNYYMANDVQQGPKSQQEQLGMQGPVSRNSIQMHGPMPAYSNGAVVNPPQSSMYSQNNFTTNNSNMAQSDGKAGPVINSVVIEALANQLKQHLLKDSLQPPPSHETASHNYVTQVLEVGTTHNVYVSHVDDGPWSFSIQLVSYERELVQLMDDLAACDLIPIKLPVVHGDPCVAKSREYDSYCRGVVVNISHSAVKIFFVDFGNTEDLPVTAIFELPVRFFKVKAMSQKFALSGLQRIKPSEEIKKAFLEVVENEMLLLHVTTLEGENLPTCDLYLKNVNIKRMLNEKVLQCRKWDALQPPQQGEVEPVVVTWIDSPQKFYVQLKRYDNELENLKRELAEWGAKGEYFNPDELVPGALCVCCFTGDNEWYRAVILTVHSKSSVTVFYVDYGNVEVVNTAMIKKLGTGLIRKMSTQAIQCCLHGFENKPHDMNMTNTLEALILEKELKLQVIYTDKDRIVVKLFDNDNDISLLLLEKVMLYKPVNQSTAPQVRDETTKHFREKTDVHSKKIEDKTKLSQNKYQDDKSWKKRDEKTNSDSTVIDTWRSDDSWKDGKKEGAKEKHDNKKRYNFRTQGKKEDSGGEKNWRSVEKWSNSDYSKSMGKSNVQRPNPTRSTERVAERAKRVARETQERGLKMHEVSITRYPLKLEDIALSGSAFKEKHIQIGTVQEVIVTYFMSPNEVYVQLVSTKEEFRRLMDEIQLYYSTKLPVAISPKKGDVVVARFKGDDVLYRATVIEANPLTVRYVDYGNEEVTDKERVWAMDKRFLKLESQSLKCTLPDLLPNGVDKWPVPDAQIDKIFEFETYSCTFRNYRDGVYDVDLIITENGRHVSDELISSGFAVRSRAETEATSTGEKATSTDFTLMCNETYRVYVSHIIDAFEFYAQIDRSVLHAIEEDIKKWSKVQEPNSNRNDNVFRNDELCLVIQEGNWRRGKIIRKSQNDAFVRLIDYGDKISVSYSQMKKISNDLAMYPPQAVPCSLFCEVEIIPDEVALQFKTCSKKYFNAFVHDVSENRLKVTLYDSNGDILEFFNKLSDVSSQVHPIADMPVSQEVLVVPSCIVSFREIYLQRVADSSALNDLNLEMQEFYGRGGDDFEEDESNVKLCAAKSVEYQYWYRARILHFDGASANVFYIDFGNVEKVPLENIKRLDPSFYEIPAFCKRVSLNIETVEKCCREVTHKLTSKIMDKECIGYFEKLNGILYAELLVDSASVTEQLLSEKVKKVSVNLFKGVVATNPVPIGYKDGSADVEVFIPHMSSPSEFWVHHENISNELEAFQNSLQIACSKGSAKRDVKVGDVVGVLFTDQIWYRAKIVSVEEKGISVQFIDYGNTWTIETEKGMMELSESLIKVPTFARRCSLRGEWKKGASSRFEEIITKHQDPFTLVELKSGDPRIVDLFYNGISLTEQLVLDGYEVGAEDEDSDVVCITHINSPSDFYVQKHQDKLWFDVIINGLLDTELFEGVEEVKENEVYCVKYPENDMWYRAKLVKRRGKDFFVHFIDYGNSCHVSELKALPSDLASIPPLSLNCCLLYGNENDTWSEAACNKFKEYMSITSLGMEIVLEGAQKSVVKLYTEDGESLTDILEELCEKDDRAEVFITQVNSPSDFYIRKINDENAEIVAQRLASGDTFKDLDKKEVGTYCLAKSIDGSWCRCIIRNVCEKSCVVFLIDYGTISMSSDFKVLPEDLKLIEPLAKNCALNFPVTNIPESIKEDFIFLACMGDSVFRVRVVKPGERDFVSLILDGKKLEEVLLYTISENSDIYNISFDIENQSNSKAETGEEPKSEKFNSVENYGDANLEDNLRTGNVVVNETDEEKRVKFAIISSDNTEGFRSDDEKGILGSYPFSSQVVNVSDELLEGSGRDSSESQEKAQRTVTEDDAMVSGEASESSGSEGRKKNNSQNVTDSLAVLNDAMARGSSKESAKEYSEKVISGGESSLIEEEKKLAKSDQVLLGGTSLESVPSDGDGVKKEDRISSSGAPVAPSLLRRQRYEKIHHQDRLLPGTISNGGFAENTPSAKSELEEKAASAAVSETVKEFEK